MARGTRITWATSRYILGKHDGIRVRIDAHDACEMSERIFAYRMLPVNPTTGEQAGYFSHVCSPPDIEEYPEDEPVPGQRPQWFRLTYIDVLVRSLDEADNLVEAVVEDVRRLKLTLDVMDTIVPIGTEDVGTICLPEPAVSSVSSVVSSVSSESSVSEGPLLTLTAHGTTEQDIGTVGIEWTANGTGAGSPLSDSNYSQVLLHPAFSSKLLLIQGFDFSELPDDAAIEGISVTLRSRWVEQDDELTYCPQITFLALHHPDVGLIDSESEGDCVPGPAFTDVLAGAADDLWDEAWTATLLKRGEFGVGLLVALPVEAGVEIDSATVQVDGAEITLHYR